MRNDLMKQEVQEAVYAGEQALISLKTAKEKLNSARNWGIADLFGGGFFIDLIKHSKLNDAASYIEDARQKLQIFQRELRDVQVSLDLRMEISGFLTFADFFFDGLIADYLVQSRIAEAREQVEDAICRVEALLADLRGWEVN